MTVWPDAQKPTPFTRHTRYGVINFIIELANNNNNIVMSTSALRPARAWGPPVLKGLLQVLL